MGQACVMGVRQWAAVRVPVSGGAEEGFGQVAGEEAIPSAMRRRMGRLERLAIRCTLGVLQGETTDELIFSSRYGNTESLISLLRGIAEGQLMSPMGFSGSVHNAVPGLVGQIRRERLSHTAIAAGRNSLAAALIEGFARLTSDECGSVTVTFADLPLPSHFHEFDDEASPGIALAMRLGLAPVGEAGGAVRIGQGRQAALALLERLNVGPIDLALETTS